MALTSYERLNSMEDTEFIEGTVFTLNFTMLDGDGAALDLTGASVEVRVAYLGQPETSVVTLTGVLDIIPNNAWTATFESVDTEGLYGAFVMQPVITDAGADVFFPAQGNLVIVPANA